MKIPFTNIRQSSSARNIQISNTNVCICNRDNSSIRTPEPEDVAPFVLLMETTKP